MDISTDGYWGFHWLDIDFGFKNLFCLWFNIYSKKWLVPYRKVPLLGILLKDNEISKTERRKLKQAPVLNYEKVVDGSYFTDLDDYTLDQMPARDVFRKIKKEV